MMLRMNTGTVFILNVTFMKGVKIVANIIARVRPKLKSAIDEDGARFYYDITTRNVSFLQTAADLRTLGIKNNQFFLKIYDRELVGVDPFSPTLSKELIQRIGIECTLNPWYFRRECVRIPSQGGGVGPGSGDLFGLHRGNLALSWCFDNCISFYIVIPRQTWKTQSTLANYNYAFLYGTTNSQFNFVNKTQPDSDDNLKKLKAQKDSLPIYMQQKFQIKWDEMSGENKIVKGTDNVRTISNPITGNKIVCKASANTEAKADGIGRGNSAPLQYYDEAEFTNFIGVILQASGPAYYEAASHAAKNGAMYGRVITSTPGFSGTEPVEAMNMWRDNMAIFTEKMYDMPAGGNDGWVEYIKKNSRNGFVYIEFTYKQIGRDENWYQGMCETLNHDPIRIKRELLLQRISGNSKSPFDPEDLEDINSYRSNPIEDYIVHDNYLLHVYKKIDPSIPYMLSVDVSTGTNEDNTVAVAIDPYSECPVAILKTALMDEPECAEVLCELVERFFPKACLAIERNNIGSSVINIIRRTKYRNHLYNDPTRMNNTPDDKLDKKGMLVKKAENSKYWGVYTEGNSRQRMMYILLNRAIHEKDKFVCNEIIDEMNTLVKKSSGRIEADSGKHDDCVMAYLIGMYVLENGYALKRYGIIQGLKYATEQERNNMLEAEENDPVKMWEALPDAYKKIFPKPNTVIVSGASPEAKLESDDYYKALREEGMDPVYNQIQNVQKRRAMRKAIMEGEDPDNYVLGADNEMIKEMVEMARMSSRNGGGYSQASFDIADMLNK